MARTSTSVNAVRDRAAKHGASRLLTYAPPWLVWLALLPLASAGYLLWGRDVTAAPWFSMGTFALVAVLVGWTWKLLAARDEMLRWFGTVCAGLAGVWFILGSLLGPIRPILLSLWGMGGFFACVMWTIRRAVLNGAKEEGEHRGDDRLKQLLDGARIHKPKQIEGRVVGKIEADRGRQTVEDLQRMAGGLESLHGLRRGAVRIGTTDDHGMGTLSITPGDPLKGAITWPGPSMPGESIADGPIPIGMHEDGLPAEIWLSGDDAAGRALSHWLVMGMNGAGKSQGWVMAMADALTRSDFELWGSDHVKGSQTFGPLADYMTRIATTKAETKSMLADALQEAAERFADLGKRGYKQWEKGCGWKLKVVWIEEASEIVADSQAFVRLVERARSAGIVIVISLQRASHDNIDTSGRAQLAAVLCFGVRDATDSTFALPDTVLDAGACPDAWGNRKPGYSYLVAPGIDEERWPVPLRTFRAQDEQIAADLERYGTRIGSQSTARSSQVAAVEDDDDMDDFASLPAVGGDFDDEGEDGLEPMPPVLDRDLHVDPDAPIGPPPADIPFVVPGPGGKLSTADARAIVQTHLATLIADGRTHTQPADIGAMKPPTTRTREWIRQELMRLCAEPGPGEIALDRDLADPPGVFRIVIPVNAGV